MDEIVTGHAVALLVVTVVMIVLHWFWHRRRVWRDGAWRRPE